MVSEMLGRSAMKLVVAVQALAAVAVGLSLLNVNVLPMVAAHAPMLVKPLQALVGLCGLAGLLELVAGQYFCEHNK